MHFQWASDDRWSQHVRSGRGLCWNYVTLMNRILHIYVDSTGDSHVETLCTYHFKQVSHHL